MKVLGILNLEESIDGLVVNINMLSRDLYDQRVVGPSLVHTTVFALVFEFLCKALNLDCLASP